MHLNRFTKLLVSFFIGVITIIITSSQPSALNSINNEPTPKISERVIIVGDDIDYPPFSYLDKNNRPTGFNIELIQAVAKVMGLEVEFQLRNWNETKNNLREGKIDIISGMFYSAEREKEFNFSSNHSVASSDIFTRMDYSIKSIDELRGLDVVVVKNDIIHEFLLSQNLDIEFIEVDTVANALRLISAGEYDYAAVLKLSGHYVINHHNLNNLKSNSLHLNPQNYSFAVKIGNDDLVNALNEGLVILNATGQYREIYNRWLGVYTEDTSILSFFRKYYWLLYTIILLVFGLFIWNILLRKVVSSRTMELMNLNLELQQNQEEFAASNEELEASLGQLLATEEELRYQYDKLKDSEERYKKLVTEMHQGLALHQIVVDENGEPIDYIFVDVNRSYEKLTGIHREDLIGKKVTEVFPNIQKYWIRKLGQVALTGNVAHFEKFNNDLNKFFEIVAYRPRPMKFAIILSDITERKRIEQLIKLSEENFRMLFEGSSDPILLMDSDNKFIDCNTATVTTFGYDKKGDIIGKNPWHLSPERQLCGESSQERALEIIDHANKEGKNRFEWWHKKKDGTILPMDIIMTSISMKDKKLLHIVCRDISDRKRMEQRLEFLSYHDQLTGLYNRRYFENELIKVDIPSALPLTIVMADVNGLKLINDAFGHAAGDELLIKVASVLKRGCRQSDILARLGGDEFIIILPNTHFQEAEEIVKTLKKNALDETVQSINLSISFGISTKSCKYQNIHEILRNAEDDMYKKKLYESPSIRSKNINLIIKTLNEKCAREEAHSHRVSSLCRSFGEALNLSDEKIHELKIVGLLHDIGKIAIEGDILNKPGKLIDEEWKEIKRHPEIGYRLLSSLNEMSDIAEYVLAHHESWDGKGYPKGLKGEEIPLQARIISIADAYDAMTSQRSYREAMSSEQAIEELKKCSSKQFDPNLVEIFINSISSFE